MKNLIISACLVGCNTRYNGEGCLLPAVKELMQHYHLIPVCPEQLGGLPTPRTPAENIGGRVMGKDGTDCTGQFRKGAEEVLRLAKLFDCDTAVLKERSPSCGYGRIYDGTFSGVQVDGSGVTAALLAENGIRILGESRINELL